MNNFIFTYQVYIYDLEMLMENQFLQEIFFIQSLIALGFKIELNFISMNKLVIFT